MMFLQYAAPGFTLPILSHYLKNHLGFEPVQVGWIMAMPAIAAMVAPFFMAYVADRAISAERLLAVCHALAGILMLILYRQDGFWPFLLLYFAYGLLFVPTFALTNAVAFHHVRDAKREFGAIRMWGPASWVVVAFGFSILWLRGEPADAAGSRLPHALVLCAVSSWALALYALTLPRGHTGEKEKGGPAFWKTVRLFADPSLLLLCALTFLNAVVHQFYYFGMSPFLSQIGFADRHIMPAMSMGQLGEVFALLLLGRCIARLGVKRALIIGVLAQVARCVVFASGKPALALLMVPSHGVCYAFFFTVAYIYVDSHSPPAHRAGAQQLFNILIAGFGNLAGNLVAGKTAQMFTVAGTRAIDFRVFWLVSAGIAVVIASALALFFRPSEKAKP